MKHKVKHVHFVGIGGSGMSGIAEVLLNLGYQVSGSDLSSTAITRRLKKLGAVIHTGHARTHVEPADAVVTSTAISPDNPEVMAARERNIPVVPRAIMLAELLRLRQGIAIAGTHGKTTTTSLVTSILAEAGMDPTFVIGGRLEAAGSHAKLGQGEFIVVEADESDASFLHLQPVLAVVTNIDADHMETYGHDISKLRQAFIDFLQHLPFYGMAVLCLDDGNVREILPAITKPITTYGLSDAAQVRAIDISHNEGRMHFTAVIGVNGKARKLKIMLNLPGLHNVQNALAAIAVCNEIGVKDAAIIRALANFEGVDRRFQRYGEIDLTGNGVDETGGGSFTLIDDYGHHPAEMAATIAAARGAFPDRRLVLAFQPHRYTRTRDLFEDFVKVLSTTDVLLLAEVYPAGEAPIVAADSKSLARALRVLGKVEPIYVETIDELPAAIQSAAQDGDVVLVMGAGSVGAVALHLAKGP
ncbi:MAG TPA: UDP-N-acetylmuramate--L-alanine ligase [Nitrosospira sp.]|jgi:UDP-N-acetylmuramate--alanine ligase|nr:UDP-N-acetylmuramate--L-alanine ligase [Nitrosospira sp.]